MNKEELRQFNEIIKPIIDNPEFQKRKKFAHHGDITVYEHSMNVAKRAFIMAKKMGVDERNCASAGLLHDFYFKPWQNNTDKQPLLKKHGFVHAREAMINSYRYFPELMNKKIANSILRHMFPLNKIPPKYKEGWIITLCDKQVSMEVFNDFNRLPELVGIKLNNTDIEMDYYHESFNYLKVLNKRN